MSTMYGEPCQRCDKAPLLRLGTVDGRLIEVVEKACDCERKRRGVCKLCPAPVNGVPGKSVYCATHRKELDRQQQLAWKRRNLKTVRAKQAAAARAKYREPAERERKRQQCREDYQQRREIILARQRARRRWKHPKYQDGLEKRREYKRKWRDENREKLKAYRREWTARKRAEREAAARPPEQQQFNRAA